MIEKTKNVKPCDGLRQDELSWSHFRTGIVLSIQGVTVVPLLWVRSTKWWRKDLVPQQISLGTGKNEEVQYGVQLIQFHNVLQRYSLKAKLFLLQF